MIWIPRGYPEEIGPGRDPVETLEAEHPTLMRLLRRARRGTKTWWNTWRTYEKAWAKPKVIWMEMSQYGRFAYDHGQLLTVHTGYAIYNTAPWLCALLNSRTYTWLARWLARRLARRTGAHQLRWMCDYTKALPVPEPSPDQRREMNRLCREMAAHQRRRPADADDAEPWSAPEEREIDDWMARRLNLTTAERAILDAMTRHE